MFTRILSIVLLAFPLAMLTANADMTLLEEAAEFEYLDVRVTADGQGELRLRNCDECEQVRLRIVPTTRLEVNGKNRPLAMLNRGTLRDGVVLYDPEKLHVKRIVASQ